MSPEELMQAALSAAGTKDALLMKMREWREAHGREMPELGSDWRTLERWSRGETAPNYFSTVALLDIAGFLKSDMERDELLKLRERAEECEQQAASLRTEVEQLRAALEAQREAAGP